MARFFDDPLFAVNDRFPLLSPTPPPDPAPPSPVGVRPWGLRRARQLSLRSDSAARFDPSARVDSARLDPAGRFDPASRGCARPAASGR